MGRLQSGSFHIQGMDAGFAQDANVWLNRNMTATRTLEATTKLRDGGASADYALVDSNGTAVIAFNGYTRKWGTELSTGAEVFVSNKVWLQILKNTREGVK